MLLARGHLKRTISTECEAPSPYTATGIVCRAETELVQARKTTGRDHILANVEPHKMPGGMHEIYLDADTERNHFDSKIGNGRQLGTLTDFAFRFMQVP